MSKFRGLLLAVDLAISKRDQALTVLQSFRRNHAFAQGQMDQLQQYAAETEQRWTISAQIGTSAELLHHHYQFMARLQQAVVLQQSALATSGSKVQVAQQQLLDAEFRIASLKLVLTKRQGDLAKQQQRQEQKQMDEFASMQTLRQVRLKLENSHEH
jgi:flagellar FliJ protein